VNLRALFTRRNPARELALIGHEKRRQTVREKAQEMRLQMGMEPHPALEVRP
jgi:hypothetical protein